MLIRTVLIVLGLLVLTYAGAPVLATPNTPPDACCSADGLCPEGMACLVSTGCSPDSPGYCVLISGGTLPIPR
jgi:hypothetical protein